MEHSKHEYAKHGAAAVIARLRALEERRQLTSFTEVLRSVERREDEVEAIAEQRRDALESRDVRIRRWADRLRGRESSLREELAEWRERLDIERSRVATTSLRRRAMEAFRDRVSSSLRRAEERRGDRSADDLFAAWRSRRAGGATTPRVSGDRTDGLGDTSDEPREERR